MLETSRLLLREYTIEDISRLYPILSDPVTMSTWPAPYDLEGVTGWIERNLVRYRDFGYGRWAVILKQTGEIIGDCGLIQTEINGQEVLDLGYIIHHPYWNQGFASEAATACLRYGIEHLGFQNIMANMAVENHSSRRVAEKLGMKLVGTFINPRNRNLETYLYQFGVRSQ